MDFNLYKHTLKQVTHTFWFGLFDLKHLND